MHSRLIVRAHLWNTGCHFEAVSLTALYPFIIQGCTITQDIDTQVSCSIQQIPAVYSRWSLVMACLLVNAHAMVIVLLPYTIRNPPPCA